MRMEEFATTVGAATTFRLSLLGEEERWLDRGCDSFNSVYVRILRSLSPSITRHPPDTASPIAVSTTDTVQELTQKRHDLLRLDSLSDTPSDLLCR